MTPLLLITSEEHYEYSVVPSGGTATVMGTASVISDSWLIAYQEFWGYGKSINNTNWTQSSTSVWSLTQEGKLNKHLSTTALSRTSKDFWVFSGICG